MVIDLRSDFISRPTQKMREEMIKAMSTRCSFGLRESSIQKKLEQIASRILGKEDALLFPTCTMCNQTAINIFCSPGDNYIAESNVHCVLSEGGAPAAITGAMAKTIYGKYGFIEPDDLEENIDFGDEQRPKTSLLIVENSHNRYGGTVLSVGQMKKIYRISNKYNIPIHVDGARIFNAATYLGVAASELTKYADSIAFSLNKGLSAPMGAILAGSKSFIEKAVRVRQRLGGGWRPTDIIAAAGIVALERMVERLVEDHDNARFLAEGVAECRGIFVDLDRVQTNLVIARIDHPSYNVDFIIEELEKEKIYVIKFGKNSIRMALHREIKKDEVMEVISRINKITKK